MTPKQILQQDLTRLRTKWKDKKDVWNNPIHPDYIQYRLDKNKALWIKRQLESLEEATEEYAEKLFSG